MVADLPHQARGWQDFVEGTIFPDAQAPWRDDPAFALLVEHPGLRDSIGGRISAALTQAIGLVQALAQVDLHAVIEAHRPALGLCLGFGMNTLEPYDLLRTLALDQVHAYEWVSTHVIEAAQALQALRTEDALLPTRIRLHHGTISDLSALANDSISVVYTGNVFHPEIPMTPETFTAAVTEIVRVLASGGFVLSRGSSGALEAELARQGRMLLHTPLVSVFHKG